MSKLLSLILVAALSIVLLSGCCLSHTWKDADCENPKMCTECGKTEGEALGHDWKEADCETPKTCTKCGKTEGEALGHDWKEADCKTPKICIKCDKTEGKALDHSWNDATITEPMTCTSCGATRGDSLPKYDDKAIFLDCDAFVELLAKQLDSMGYVILEWGGERPSNAIRNFEIFEKAGESIGMTLVLPYDPENLNIICLNFVWSMNAEELESEMERYTDIVTAAYGVLCPEGMDDNLQMQISAFVGKFGALITPINAPLDSIEW